MKANQLKASEELAYVVVGDYSPIVTESARVMYEYTNNERTDKIKGYATELVLTNQNFEKVRCITPNMPRVFFRWRPRGSSQSRTSQRNCRNHV